MARDAYANTHKRAGTNPLKLSRHYPINCVSLKILGFDFN